LWRLCNSKIRFDVAGAIETAIFVVCAKVPRNVAMRTALMPVAVRQSRAD